MDGDPYGSGMSPVRPYRSVSGPLLPLLVALTCACDAEGLETAVLVRDINPTNSSVPAQLTRVGDRVFFTALGDNGAVGRELWVTDGTAAGTALVRDVNPEPFRDSLIGDLTWFDDALHFGVGNPFRFGPHGLWRSDGTPGGTGAVVEVDSALGLIAAPRRLFFLAASTQSARICWLDLEHDVDCAGFALRLNPTAPAVAGDRYFVVGAPSYDTDDFEIWTAMAAPKAAPVTRHPTG